MDKNERARQRIDTLKAANYGNHWETNSLERMIKVLDQGGELERFDRKYLRELYGKYEKENEDPVKKQERKDLVIGFTAFVIIIMIIVGVVIMLFPGETAQEKEARELMELNEKKEAERKIAEEAKKLDTEEEVLEFIQNYKGKDNTGSTLDQTMTTLLNAAYPGEDIISSPSTTGGYIASRDYDKEISDRYWKVELMIKTYREAVNYEWVVDTETNLIYPGDEGSKSVLDILDSFN